MKVHLQLRRFSLEQGSNQRPLDQQASAYPTELLEFRMNKKNHPELLSVYQAVLNNTPQPVFHC